MKFLCMLYKNKALCYPLKGAEQLIKTFFIKKLRKLITNEKVTIYDVTVADDEDAKTTKPLEGNQRPDGLSKDSIEKTGLISQ